MSITSSVAKVAETLAEWLSPTRIRIARLEKKIIIYEQSIKAAEELFKIRDRVGIYEKMTDKNINKWNLHYTKQWNAWKDGTP